jgi:DNA-directed RNA polymerase specialized sigma24 family protein
VAALCYQRGRNGNEEGPDRGDAVAGKDPLPQLRQIRDELRRIEKLHPRRNRLIREAAEQGYTQQQIAKAAGLSQARIHQILISGL